MSGSVGTLPPSLCADVAQQALLDPFGSRYWHRSSMRDALSDVRIEGFALEAASAAETHNAPPLGFGQRRFLSDAQRVTLSRRTEEEEHSAELPSRFVPINSAGSSTLELSTAGNSTFQLSPSTVGNSTLELSPSTVGFFAREAVPVFTVFVRSIHSAVSFGGPRLLQSPSASSALVFTSAPKSVGRTLPPWLERVKERIRRSTVKPGEVPVEGQTLAVDVSAAAVEFFDTFGDLLGAEPFLSGSRRGELVAEVRTEGGGFTMIISPQLFVYFDTRFGRYSYQRIEGWKRRVSEIRSLLRPSENPRTD